MFRAVDVSTWYKLKKKKCKNVTLNSRSHVPNYSFFNFLKKQFLVDCIPNHFGMARQ